MLAFWKGETAAAHRFSHCQCVDCAVSQHSAALHFLGNSVVQSRKVLFAQIKRRDGREVEIKIREEKNWFEVVPL